ncbi:family 10 glycosylhydrolase [Echinicola jeungdonensis]|uniref:Glycoside hydrolase family 10 protein n=1 Tax=Echinicola jeungdonensis TaxID=709343 RepID=A0ABV5J9D6_9BACT|nr:family 10 glycosylhydrolase [Echinicola jeungdonensis]MDN3669215.1 family 10 glycosylhydrolase [Echinicola jeungdonensis]
MMLRNNCLLLLICLLTACASNKNISRVHLPWSPKPEVSSPEVKPKEEEKELTKLEEKKALPAFEAPKRELRGVWIATIANIDWPVSPQDDFAQQQKDFIQILDFYKQRNFNAVFVQIRASGDAFYPSHYAPWSKYLTGKQGKSPNTAMNPLTWMIQEAHQRGMEFHAWLNPFRATSDLNTDQLSPNHDYFKHPEWMVEYAGKYYYNPGLPSVQNHMLEIVGEVVENYKIDGVHFDDYFYPYKVSGLTFNDQLAYQKYGKDLSLGDWRRSNVNDLIRNVNNLVEEKKPWVQFGVSPFGVWRNASVDPKGSDTKAGHTNYDDLYADPLTWMKNGWVDYLIPQIYWSMDFPEAAYRELVQWWADHSHGTRLYLGNGAYKVRNNQDKSWNDKLELSRQVAWGRRYPQVAGNVFFRAKSLMGLNRDVADVLENTVYQQPVLTPPKSVHPAEVFDQLVPELESKHLSSQGLQVRIGNAYLAKAVALYGFDGTGWKALQTQYAETSLDGEVFVFKQFLENHYDYLAIGFLGNFGQTSQTVVFQP